MNGVKGNTDETLKTRYLQIEKYYLRKEKKRKSKDKYDQLDSDSEDTDQMIMEVHEVEKKITYMMNEIAKAKLIIEKYDRKLTRRLERKRLRRLAEKQKQQEERVKQGLPARDENMTDNERLEEAVYAELDRIMDDRKKRGAVPSSYFDFPDENTPEKSNLNIDTPSVKRSEANVDMNSIDTPSVPLEKMQSVPKRLRDYDLPTNNAERSSDVPESILVKLHRAHKSSKEDAEGETVEKRSDNDIDSENDESYTRPIEDEKYIHMEESQGDDEGHEEEDELEDDTHRSAPDLETTKNIKRFGSSRFKYEEEKDPAAISQNDQELKKITKPEFARFMNLTAPKGKYLCIRSLVEVSNLPEGSENPNDDIFVIMEEDEPKKTFPRVEPSKPLTDFATSKASDGNSQLAEGNPTNDLEVIDEDSDVNIGYREQQQKEMEIFEKEIDGLRQDLGLKESDHSKVDEEVKHSDVS